MIFKEKKKKKKKKENWKQLKNASLYILESIFSTFLGPILAPHFSSLLNGKIPCMLMLDNKSKIKIG